MTRCITCGTQLHPERAKKYNYCMAPECQEKNARGLTVVAIGMNKAADEFMILDERTREDLASGKYRDQRRGSFGTSAAAPPKPVTPPTSLPSGTAAEPAQAAPAGRPAGAGASHAPAPRAVDAVAGETRAALQRAGPAAGRDRAEARHQLVPGDADHPVGEEPRKDLAAVD